MKILHKAAEWKEYLTDKADRTVGFVPTMGALHEGHLSLMKKSLEENDITVVSIYLNPTQFNDKSDLDKYPKTWNEDIRKLEEHGIDVLFAPDYTEMYPDEYKYKVSESELSGMLCGAARPGHFDGVLTVVLKLFGIVGKCRAYFGEKDYQQLMLIKGMTEAFFLSVGIVPCPIVREDDGLAMSSRNLRLSREGRGKAPLFYKYLSGGKGLPEIRKQLEEAGFRVDYLEDYIGRRFGAVFLEEVRLIDNVEIR